MGLDDVKNEILDEAEQEKNEILEEAEDRRQEILDEAEEEAKRIRSEAEEEIEEDKASREKKAVSNANMKAKQKKLNAKEKALDQAFESFREELRDLSDDEKESMIENAIESAKFDVGLVKGSDDFEDLTDTDFESADVKGFILVSDDGERQLNFTFDKITDDYRAKYRKDVAEELLG